MRLRLLETRPEPLMMSLTPWRDPEPPLPRSSCDDKALPRIQTFENTRTTARLDLPAHQ